MNKLYTDASFDWNSTEQTTDNVVRGKIAITDNNGFKRIEKVAIGKVPTLKQYINIFELFAIGRAIELAIENNFTDTLSIYSDSQVALSWAKNGFINRKIETDAHWNVIEYFKRIIQKYQGKIDFNFVGRDNNPAGWMLAEELEKESPHS